jgi:hypothetical protein
MKKKFIPTKLGKRFTPAKVGMKEMLRPQDRMNEFSREAAFASRRVSIRVGHARKASSCANLAGQKFAKICSEKNALIQSRKRSWGYENGLVLIA